MNLESKGFQIELELAAKTGEVGILNHVPINYRKRLGQTKMSPTKEGFNVFKDLLAFSKVYNPTLLFSIFAGILIIPGFVILAWMGARWLIDPEDYRPGITQIAIVLTIIGSNGIAFALLSSHLRRIERKINHLIWKNEMSRNESD